MQDYKRTATDRRGNDRRMSSVIVEDERRDNQRRSGVDRRTVLSGQV